VESVTTWSGNVKRKDVNEILPDGYNFLISQLFRNHNGTAANGNGHPMSMLPQQYLQQQQQISKCKPASVLLFSLLSVIRLISIFSSN
jgi:hypothetical protein